MRQRRPAGTEHLLGKRPQFCRSDVRPYVERFLRVQRLATSIGTRETVLPCVRPLCASSKVAGLDEVRCASSQTACRTLRCVGIIGLSRVGISSRWFIVVIGTVGPLGALRSPPRKLVEVSLLVRRQLGSFRSLLLVCGNACLWSASRRRSAPSCWPRPRRRPLWSGRRVNGRWLELRPPFGAHAVLMDTHDGAVDHRVFEVGITRQGIEKPLEGTVLCPPTKALEDRVPRPEVLRKIAPGCTDPSPPKHDFQKQPIGWSDRTGRR